MMFMSVKELCKLFHICMKTTSANANKKFSLILNSERVLTGAKYFQLQILLLNMSKSLFLFSFLVVGIEHSIC